MSVTSPLTDRSGSDPFASDPIEAQLGPRAPSHPILTANPDSPAPVGDPTGQRSVPILSVIVAAHLRQEYIVDAVRSVVGSGLAPEHLDIVVTKGYRSPEQDEVLRKLGARVYFDYDVGVGLQLWRALPLTRAPLIAFLDDDDQFEPTRLDHVIGVFRDHPDIGFYHNRLNLIDLDGHSVSPTMYGAMERDAGLDRTGPLTRLSGKNPSDARVLRRLHPWFNTSSMVIRRDVLMGRFGQFLETAHHAPDVRLFLIAILSGTGIYMDDRRLTRYRTSAPTWQNQARRALDDLTSVDRTCQLAERFAERPWVPQFRKILLEAQKRSLWADFVSRLDRSQPRASVMAALTRYLRFLIYHPRAISSEPSRLFYLACFATYLVAPSSGSAILSKALATSSINRSKRRTGREDTPPVR
ncbi:MAG: glycosyltransferase family 2 protein [Thermoplasmata archaeon]